MVAGIAIVGVLLALAMRFSDQRQDEAQARREMAIAVFALPDHLPNAAYYDHLMETCHRQAFANVQPLAGDRLTGTLQTRPYLLQMARMMAAQASAEGHEEVARRLEFYREMLAGTP
jgi:hypothetical protein